MTFVNRFLTRIRTWTRPKHKESNLQAFDGHLVDRSNGSHTKWDTGPTVEDLRLTQALIDFEKSTPVFPRPLESNESGDESEDADD